MRKLISVLLILFIFYMVSYLVQFLFNKSQNIQIAAHRGDSKNFPENTMHAFKSAFDKGADYIELDLHQTKDGVVVVIHDSTLDRTTNGTGRVSDYSYEEIRKLDAGGSYIPTLEEVLVLAKEKKGKIMAEIKSPEVYPGINERVHSLLQRSGLEQKTIIASFNKKELEEFKKKYPAISTCLVYNYKMILPLEPGNSEYVCIPAENTLLNPWSVWYAHKNDKKIFVWFQFLENNLTVGLIKMLGVEGLILNNLD